MSEWNSLYLSHIGLVKADYTLTAPNLDPDEITRILSIEPGYSCRRGDPRLNNRGEPMGGEEKEGGWQIDSGSVESKDINAHINSLLAKLLPHEDAIANIVKNLNAKSYFGVLWESSYLYAGTGPMLEMQTIEGIARLHASIGFDIYQIDSDDENTE